MITLAKKTHTNLPLRNLPPPLPPHPHISSLRPLRFSLLSSLPLSCCSPCLLGERLREGPGRDNAAFQRQCRPHGWARKSAWGPANTPSSNFTGTHSKALHAHTCTPAHTPTHLTSMHGQNAIIFPCLHHSHSLLHGPICYTLSYKPRLSGCCFKDLAKILQVQSKINTHIESLPSQTDWG